MLEKFTNLVWKLIKFTYLYHLSVTRKLYSQERMANFLKGLKNEENIESYRFTIKQLEEFLVWAKKIRKYQVFGTKFLLGFIDCI